LRPCVLVGAVAYLAAAPLLSPRHAIAAQAATLAVRTGQGVEPFWHAGVAPRRWRAAHAHLAGALEWKPTTSTGIEWAELPLQGAGEARFTRIVAVRIEPGHARFSLERHAADGRPAWHLDRAPHDAVVALNAGMFTGALPWGWLVQAGAERLAPARGPLSAAFIVRRDGGIEWVDGDALDAHRARRDITIAFQSYPALLVADGEVPAVLHTDSAASGRPRPPREADVDRTHRDARLALGIDREGRIIIALTRFDALGGVLDRIPFGLTVPEMSALMGALGAQKAMLLDGGISAQLLVRTPQGAERFSGSRKVPLGLVVRAASPR
jgi:hypothetical protein